MSGRAMEWAWERDAQGSTLLVLLAYADDADHRGVYLVGKQDEIVRKTGLSERAVRDNVGRLEGAGLLARYPRYEAGLRIADLVKLAVDGSTSVPADSAATVRESPANSLRQNLPGSSSTPTTDESGEGSRSDRQILPLVADGVPEELVADAQAMLQRKVKAGSRIITAEEMAIALAALAAFNTRAGYDYGLGAHLTAIIGRVRERPSLDADAHVRLVESAWRLRWWERKGNGRRPTPGVVYGNAQVFEQVIADATDEKAGREAPATTRRFERKSPRGRI